jgi:transcriptional regulator with XRE-family HTH domain
MAKKGDPEVLRRVVGFLRLHAGMTQAEFGEASRIDQGDISRYESGKETPPEKCLRRMAKAAKVPWPLVVLLTRFVESFLKAVARRGPVRGAEPLDPAVLEPGLLAVIPYLIENAVESPGARAGGGDGKDLQG